MTTAMILAIAVTSCCVLTSFASPINKAPMKRAAKAMFNEGNFNLNDRSKRFALYVTKWPTTNLTYRFINFPNNTLTELETKTEIRKAFEVWSADTKLDFKLVTTSTSHLSLLFTTGMHNNCFFPMDGQGGSLAHTYPPSDGHIHFDDAERWTVFTSKHVIHLMEVAVSQIGHALGLKTSPDPQSVMYLYYMHRPTLKLAAGDIAGIEAMYGK